MFLLIRFSLVKKAKKAGGVGFFGQLMHTKTDEKRKAQKHGAPAAPGMRVAPSPSSKMALSLEDEEAKSETKNATITTEFQEVSFASSLLPSSSPPPSSSPAETDAVRNLIKCQSANGSFNLNALQNALPKVTIDNIRQMLKDLKLPVNEKTELIAITVTTTLIFALKYAAQKTLWDLVVTKAKTWVKKELAKENINSPDIVTNLEEAAKKLLATHGIKSA